MNGTGEHLLAQKAKSDMFSLIYVQYRPTTNAAILWGVGHTKWRSHTVGIG
jgi:hypothetical protein